MMIIYICKKCGQQFDGHWHRGKDQYTCTECGHVNTGRMRNIDCDEDFSEPVENDWD